MKLFYITPDPIGLIGGINLYEYSESNPINLFDRWGLQVGSAVRTSPIGPDPSAHNVFHPGSFENQLIGDDIIKLGGLD